MRIPKQTKYQKFKVESVSRKSINFAGYNPNELSSSAKRQIKKKLKDPNVGLIEAIVWNKRTGNLVGGHHRLELIDELEKGTDYVIDVCVVDLDLKTEKEMNVFLNNPSVQGEYNLNTLASFKMDDGISFDDMGFTESDVDFMFGGDSDFSKLFEDVADVETSKGTIDVIKKGRKDMQKKYDEKNTADFYFVVVCESDEQKKKLVKLLNTPAHERFVNAEYLERLIG